MKENFLVRTEWYDAIKDLKLNEQASVFQNLFLYHMGMPVDLKSPSVKLIWKMIEPNLKRNIENYDKRQQTSAENGKSGGRPAEVITDINGVAIPPAQDGLHFSYIIHDSEKNIYKVGETSDLLKRRLSIKRPTRFLSIVKFSINKASICYKWEGDILRDYASDRISGDWLQLDEKKLNEIVSRIILINLNKPTNKPIILNNPDSVDDSVSVSVSDSVEERVSFPDQIHSDRHFVETTCKAWGVNVQQMGDMIREFVVFQSGHGKVWKDYNDCKGNFYSWGKKNNRYQTYQTPKKQMVV